MGKKKLNERKKLRKSEREMKAYLAFVTLSSILTIMPFRVNELHVSNVTSLS